MLLLLLAACSDYTIQAPAPAQLGLVLNSPSYGAFLGAGPVVVDGTVTPTTAVVHVNGTLAYPDADGHFVAELPFDARAVLVDVTARFGGEEVRELVPVFDGSDPRASDPGAVSGLLAPAGLDALEPTVASLVDGLGLEDLLLSSLPAIETDYLSLVPRAVTSSGAVADLSPGEDAIAVSVGLGDLTVLTDVDILGWLSFELGVSLGTVRIGAYASPWVDEDGMLGLTLTDAIVEIADISLSVEGLEIPDEITDLLLDPVAELVSGLGETLGDLLLDQAGELTLGGPFAFDLDLLGTALSAQLVEVAAGSTGVALGATVGYGEDAASSMPEVSALDSLTPSGKTYQLGLGVHEGMLNVLIDETLSSFLDIDLELAGEYGQLLGTGFATLDGGDEIPSDADGYCLGLEVGDARVVRMVEGEGAPLAIAWLPDVRLDIDVIQGGACVDWLDANLFATLELGVEGTELSADLGIRDVTLLAYGAEDYDRDAVEEQLGGVIEGLAGLLAGQLSFDLGDVLGGGGLGLGLTPEIVSVEPLDADGLYGVYLDVFGEDL